MDMPSMKKIKNSEDHYCFACSAKNPHGLHMNFYTDGEKVISPVILPQHVMGWDDIAHGGIVSTLLDEIMSWASMILLRKIILTMNMSVIFKKPVYIGEELTVEGRVLRLVHSRKAEMASAVYNKEGILCAEGKGLFALFKPEEAKKRNIISDRHIDEFTALIHLNSE